MPAHLGARPDPLPYPVKSREIPAGGTREHPRAFRPMSFSRPQDFQGLLINRDRLGLARLGIGRSEADHGVVEVHVVPFELEDLPHPPTTERTK